MSPQLKTLNNPRLEQNNKFVPIFEWFERELLDDIKTVSNDFWGVGHNIKLTAFSVKHGPMLGDNDYFVTQMKMTSDVIFFVRISKNSIKHFLNKSLGEIDYIEGFDFNQVTNLEGTIITAYSNVIYSRLKKLVLKKSAQKIEEFDEDFDSGFCHFTFYTVFGEEEGSLIISLPYKILPAIEDVKEKKAHLPLEHFEYSPIATSVCVGSTKMSVDDIKSLESEDIVVLENSKINKLQFEVLGEKWLEVTSSKDLSLDLDDEDNQEDNIEGGMNMGIQSQGDVWDGIQVDVQAQFEKVKLTMGELRQLSEGLIVDVAPVFSNQITLAIEDMPIAKGELVIIEDNYAVRLTEILKQEPKPKASVPAIQEKSVIQESVDVEDNDDNDDDDFDYEAFDIDEDEI